MDLRFRPVQGSDEDFLREVFASARADELAAVQWPKEQKAAFVEHQFRAQASSYRTHFPNATYEIVLADSEPVGRLYLDRRSDEIRILELTLLTQFRNQGIGTQLLRGLCAEARQKGHLVGVHITRQARSMNLARRLGFEKRLEAEHTDFMVWDPAKNLAFLTEG